MQVIPLVSDKQTNGPIPLLWPYSRVGSPPGGLLKQLSPPLQMDSTPWAFMDTFCGGVKETQYAESGEEPRR